MSNNNYRLWQARKIIVEKQKATARDNAAVWNSTEQDKPTLTTLPAEVRNSIYHYALCRVKKITITRTPERRVKGNASSIAPNLLRTCKLIHREARPFFYSGNHFIVPSIHLQHFLATIKFSTRHLTSITFELNDYLHAQNRTKLWHAGFLQLARLVGLTELKVRLYVHADYLDVEKMASELSPIVANLWKARSQQTEPWTEQSLSKALTFSVDVKKPGSRWYGINPSKAERDNMGQEFPGKVLARLEEMSLAAR